MQYLPPFWFIVLVIALLIAAVAVFAVIGVLAFFLMRRLRA